MPLSEFPEEAFEEALQRTEMAKVQGLAFASALADNLVATLGEIGVEIDRGCLYDKFEGIVSESGYVVLRKRFICRIQVYEALGEAGVLDEPVVLAGKRRVKLVG